MRYRINRNNYLYINIHLYRVPSSVFVDVYTLRRISSFVGKKWHVSPRLCIDIMVLCDLAVYFIISYSFLQLHCPFPFLSSIIFSSCYEMLY